MQYKLTKSFISLLALAAFAPKVDAAYAYVAASAVIGRDTSSPNPTVTLGAAVPVNGLIIACGDVFGAENSNGVPTDTAGNTYTAVGLDQLSTSLIVTVNCWYAVNTSNAAHTITFHWTGTVDSTHSYAWAFTGNATSSVLVDKNKSALSTGTTQTCSTATASKVGQLVVGFIGTDGNATSFAPNSGETERGEEAVDHNDQVEDKTTAATGAISPSWTLGTTQPGACITAIFDVLGGGNIVNPLDGPVKLLRLAR